ncbi:bifunctional diguanylate cyclase/phosphodiesterase [Allorhizobium sp. BGMRC 0089]|nr:bifunctional diguanylate cyclase/phosphodiesterase [Allorhizobium sonneratiae]
MLEERVEERTAELLSERERTATLSLKDHLTELANRHRFTAHLSDVCRRVNQDKGRVTVFLADLDRFKLINDLHGHEGGDFVLRALAGRLLDVGRKGLSARLGGDEFAVIVEDLASEEEEQQFADWLLERLKAPISAHNRRFSVSASIGYASLPDHAVSSAELLRHAEMALECAKKLGRGLCVGFTPDLGAEEEERRLLELELALAVDRDEILPWYQPVFDGVSGRCLGVEVLARWQHPYRGIILPGGFLPIAEQRNLLDGIFQQLARRAFLDMASLIRTGQLRYVSINLSPRQFQSSDIVEIIHRLLKETGFPPTALVVEITEDFIMTNLACASRSLNKLSRLGIKIALDDFGTGYSNIASLSSLPLQWLKLDRSLISRVANDHVGQAIVQAVMQMAQALGIDVVAEGIETREQAQWLVDAGCRKHQGFFYSRPKPLEQLRADLLVPLEKLQNSI